MDIIKFKTGDCLKMKKNHPCGNDIFKVLKTGSDIKLQCVNCGRTVLTPREKTEKYIKKVIPSDEEQY